jgi:hypothetical protein
VAVVRGARRRPGDRRHVPDEAHVTQPGADPTKYNFPNFTYVHIFLRFFSQLCLNFSQMDLKHRLRGSILFVFGLPFQKN